jgi:hypothetical protein
MKLIAEICRNRRPQEESAGQGLCETLFHLTGAYPGPGDGHVGEFYPQFIRSTVKDLDRFQGHAIANVKKTYPPLTAKMQEIADGKAPIHDESFAKKAGAYSAPGYPGIADG